MGNCSLTKDSFDPTVSLSIKQFEPQYAIGKGGFGKVWKVVHKKDKKTFAMKEMLKVRVISKRSVHSVMNQRRLLSMLQHPFLVNMKYAFQDKTNLYLVMDYMPGGDLRYHIGRLKKFSEQTTRFFAACLVLALEYLHGNNIIHRDIKPENLVLNDKGYLKLTDFGVARIWHPNNSIQTSGTPGYMAPQVLCKSNHGVVSDYFALAVIVHQFLTGRRPYYGKNRKQIRQAILARQVQITKAQIDEIWSEAAADFFNQLIQRKPENRLGNGGIQQIKKHPWFEGFDWEALLNQTLLSPFIPQNRDNFDLVHVHTDWNDSAILNCVKQKQIQNLFSGYFYDCNLIVHTPQ